ncbi:radical SAM protein [soil metagenome]
MPEIINDSTHEFPSGERGFRRALLINPPVYDAQYWARWSQPAGLLRIATYLQARGYEVDLIDCMETNARGFVPKTYRRDPRGQPLVVTRGDMQRQIWHFGLSWNQVGERMAALAAPPDEVWITSIMTYWWESTCDAVRAAREMFPNATIFVGGIYPTLAPEHAQERLPDADYVFTGEIRAASDCWTDLHLYQTPPTYAILTTSRGCPWDCNYCAARTLNGGTAKMRRREPEDVLEEIEYKMRVFGIRHFGFYEDNALALRGHLQRILELIIERGHSLTLYAPEGFETRMLDEDLLGVMKLAGFRKVHLPFETLKWETNVGWNRRHASTASFERALQAAIRAGFKPRTEEINAFVLFGLPDDKLEDILDGVVYIHHEVGSIIPMLFTPVPGTRVYSDHHEYLHVERGWDLQHLNGKLLPFLEHNQARYPALRASDYLELEALMSVLNNGKFLSRAVNLCDDSAAARAFRSVLVGRDPKRLAV